MMKRTSAGGRAHEDGHDHRVDLDRLTRAGGSGNEDVGHLRQVVDNGVALHVLADGHLQRPGPAAASTSGRYTIWRLRLGTSMPT